MKVAWIRCIISSAARISRGCYLNTTNTAAENYATGEWEKIADQVITGGDRKTAKEGLVF